MLTLLILSMLTFAFNVQLISAGTITVPDDYPTIQEAINNANEGDTVYVRSGRYYEHIEIGKSVSLFGENKRTTIIDGNGTGTVVWVGEASGVKISGFTIQNGDYGIRLDYSHNNIISGNNITNNSAFGVRLEWSSSNTVSGNIITNSSAYANSTGVFIGWSSNNNIVSENMITNSSLIGVYLHWSSSNNTVSGNSITNSNFGVYLWYSSGHRIYHNNFIDNTQQVSSFNSVNVWDNGYPSCGNYWSDYNGTDFYSGPYQNQTGNDGIGDTPYIIDENNVDNYPLMDPWILDLGSLSHMIVAYPYAPTTLDPARCDEIADVEPILNVYETLIFFDKEKTNQFVPRLATKWDISEDGLNYTFTIRQCVKFHNNETLTTEDVEYSFERLLVIEGTFAAEFFYEAFFDLFGSRDAQGNFTITGNQINNAVTRTNSTVTFHLAKPYPPMMQILSETWSSILCKRWCIEIGDWPGTWNNWTLYNRPERTAIENQTTEPPGPHINAMCGTGPFMLDYYQTGVEWSIIKFDDYWGGWPAPSSGGFLRRVTAKIISDWETRRNMFLEGRLDHVTVPSASIDEVLGQPGIRSIYPLQELTCHAMFFTFNISVSSPYLGVPGGLPPGTFSEGGIPPDFFSDINVRLGFAYAFNYSKLIEEEFRGEAYQPATPIIPGLPFYNPAQERYSINLTKAAEHFATAWGGQLPDYGFNFTICYYQESLWRKKACEIIKANVESLSNNFHIQIQVLPTRFKYLSSALNHTLPVFLIGWLADFADPHNFALAFMCSNGTFPQFQVYSNETIDLLVREGIGTMNETARRQIYYELQRLYHEDCPSVPLIQTIGRRFERDWVQGWYYNPLFWTANYFYVQWKGSMPTSTRYSWPMFHHDLTHTGYTESPAPNTNQTQWNYTTGASVYYSSPAVADGKVYAASDRVYCLDAATGTQIWNYSTGYVIYSSPAVAYGKVYVGSPDGKVYALDASTGEHIWNYTTGNEVDSSPAVADGKVFVGSFDGKVYALDASTGVLIWNYTTGGYVESSPAVADGKVYAGSDDNRVYCLDASTGTHIWNFTTGNIVGSSPAVADGRVYVGSYDGKVYCLNALTGAYIWNYTTGNWVYSSPAVADGKVYAGSDDFRVYCLDASTGVLIWNYTTGGYVESSPAVADGKVYAGSHDGKVYCLDAATGAHIWNYTTGNLVNSSPAVADGMVYIGSYDCVVYAFGNVVRSEDYPTIQEAINDAPSGATVIIAPGIYHESLVINKTLTIIGLPGSAPTFNGGGSGIAITLLPGASGSTIAGIVITNWDQGILINDASNCKIYDNIMSLMSYSGIGIEGTNAANNQIYSNIFQENTVAIDLIASSTTSTIYKNIITSNNVGLSLQSGGNVIYANTISENNLGIDVSNSYNNIIYHNNFANYIQNAMSGTLYNAWDNGYPSGGNYWSDYTGIDEKSGANRDLPGSDGIGDTQYTIADNNVDRYPLMQPFNPHDIGVTNVITSKTVVEQGFHLRIEVKILNYGIYDETFTVNAYANTITIATQTVTLIRRNSTTVTFTWDTSGFAKGNYTISAYAWPVQGETDTADNTLIDGWVLVTIPGDVNGDRRVNILDCILLANHFGHANGNGHPPGSKEWMDCMNCDINGDSRVNILDCIKLANNFGKTDP